MYHGWMRAGAQMETTMSDAEKYTIPDSVLAAHLEGEAVLLHMDSKHYYRLNGTAAFIWKALERGASAESIVGELCETFEVGPEEAAAEVQRLLAELAESGLVAAGDAPR